MRVHLLEEFDLSRIKLTENDIIEIIRLTNQEGLSSRNIAERYGVGKSTIGDVLRKETHPDFWKSYDEKPVVGGEIHPPSKSIGRFTGKRFVFTSAQNNTHVHDKALKTLENYCKHNNAELIISTFHYNKSGFQNGSSEDLWFDPKIKPYICDEAKYIAEGLIFCGELNILPTAVNPLSGLHNYTGLDSAIVPHAKLQLESIPTPKFDHSKIMYTTGAVTQRNYIQQKAGQKAQWHHVFGALVVEVDEQGDWFVRQLVAESETGCIADLDKYYTPEKIFSNQTIEAINYGDVHNAKVDDIVAASSWHCKGSILDHLKPKYQFVHDILDQQGRNHHNIKDPHFLFKMYKENKEDLRQEVSEVTLQLKSMKRSYSKVIVVESNHDLALEKWLKEQDYRKDPVNSIFFLELQLMKYKSLERGDTNFSIFETACNMVNSDLAGIQFLKTDESFRLFGDLECGQHSHLGNNGARGSVQAYQKQGIRFNIGHSHAACIKDGVYQAGVSGMMDMGYNKGGSSWNQSHILTYSNGKRTIITLKKGKWRG